GAPDGSGSTADIAALFDLPVVLVAEARRINQSIAALLEGFIGFRQDVEVVGIVLNAVAGERHAATLLKACDERFSTPVLGWLPRHDELVVPSRHLGLVQAAEHPALDELIERLGSLVAERLDLDRLLRLARRPGVAGLGGQGARPIAALGQRIAVAQDTAFAFAYPAVLEGWRRQGAEIVPFSPLADEAPDPAADAIYLPGGYPELYAGRLAANRQFLLGLQAAAYRDVFIYGECGGYMVLGQGLIDAKGRQHPMAGLLPLVTSYAERERHLGYRRLTPLAGSPWQTPLTAHEFHYSTVVKEGEGERMFAAKDARGEDLGKVGLRRGTVSGSYMHV
ncbi:MAG: cobyrinate a,c-diamide synthase, partial [Geminicoccaceae bacterium]|nr:cobyrinate a,c-diamide synthase [Geminicoccaceae bacterium]